MPTITLLRKILLISILVFFIIRQTGSVSAGATTWVNHGPEGGNIYALVVDPVTPTTLYAGTTGGVFKSINGGQSWSALYPGLTNPIVRALAVAPTTPSTIYAGTAGNGVFAIQPVEYRRYVPVIGR